MRIGINTLFLVPGDVGGTEVYLRQNLLSLAEDNPEQTFILFTSLDNEGVLRGDLAGFTNIEFRQLPFRTAIRPLRIIIEQVLLPWYVRKNSVDVLWSPGYTAPVWCSCPQAVTIHDLQYRSHPDDLSFIERITLDFLVRSACRQCQAVITVSQFSKNEILRYNFAPEENVHAVLEGVDPTFSEPYPPGTSNPVTVPVGIPYILCVAHTYPHKQIHRLVEAFGLIAEKVPHHLVLVGRPRRGEDRVQESLNVLECKERIHRISDLQYEELRVVYQEADLFVLPSEYEGFGLPVLEAMLAGVPVITTSKASFPEVGGNHAIYTKENIPEVFAKAMLNVIHMDAKERKEWVKGGQVWAASFTWQKSASRTLQVLENLTMDDCVKKG